MEGVYIRSILTVDYASVRALWDGIPGMDLNAHDDSQAGITRLLERNPGMSFLALDGPELVGAILAGHDGRRGGIYHVCVAGSHRGRRIGQMLLDAALRALRAEGINKTRLLCYRDDEIGNRFWRQMGWTNREDTHYYDYEFSGMDAPNKNHETGANP